MNCEEDFCDSCELAGACDASCSLCGGADRSATACREVVETPAHGWCILLTTSVAPSQSMSNTQRWSPQLRLREYEASLQHWESNYPHPVYVVESSGASLDWFRSAAPTLEYISLHLNATPPVLGKGHAEFLSIKAAIDRIDEKTCTHFIKVTGCYPLLDFASVLQGVLGGDEEDLGDDISAIFQSSPPLWQIRDGVVRSEVVGFRRDLLDFLFSGQDEAHQKPMEYVLRKRGDELIQRGEKVRFFPKLELEFAVRDGGGRLIEDL